MISSPRASAGVALFTLLLGSGACARTDDDALRDAVRHELIRNPATSDLNVSATVSRRIVFLSGRTDTPEEQRRVLDAIRTVNGVNLIVNDITLNDTALADRVTRALRADPLVASILIDVDAQDGIVRLTSDATNSEQRARAVQIASALSGVKKVEDHMK